MPPKPANRFALFADDDDHEHEAEKSPLSPSPFANQVADDDAPWKEVRRGGQAQKAKTLVIRDDRTRPPPANRRQKHRDVSGSTQASNASDKPMYENYCGVCNYHCSSKASLVDHIKHSPKAHANFCNLCKRVFKDRNGLKNHLENSLGHDVFCNLCLSAFQNQWALKNHFENNYAVGHEFVCLTCLLGFRTKMELSRHLQTGEKHVWCNTCHRRFRNQDERDAHWKETAKHKHCLQPGCDFDASNAAELEQHLENDHFQCEGCRLIFPSNTKLSLHYHTCAFDVPCPNCGTLFPGPLKLAAHSHTCFFCTQCGFRTDTDEEYQFHLTTHTTPNSPLPCWACKSLHHTPLDLTTHLETCPSIPPTLLLSILGKWWYSPLYMDLDIHAQIRRNELNFDLEQMTSWVKQGILHPFICRAESCEHKTFSKLSELVEHFEGRECAWGVERLRLDKLRVEFERVWERRDSVAGSVALG
ncbi:hypothetical protein CC80DRAFT_81882 [Byssothecium circinans]|uniref:C2H2-type domain-containing protein n=1 Tax=Byssothecium circinans TaxID=147558 RepID=A0A6A5TTC1_9PLEO|nr:hypothetical protein CC80DRAFT_81882 [Byssothecium circinans]